MGRVSFMYCNLCFYKMGDNALCKLRTKDECKLTISRVGQRKMIENFVVSICWG